MPAADTSSATPLSLRFGLVLAGVALLLNFHFFTVGWGHTLLGNHEMRQLQTAISSYYVLQDGASLDYITPLLGPPWQVPLELPLYQISAAWCAQLTGLPLDAAGRLTSWLYFLSCLPACYLLLAEFRLPAGQRLLFLALLLVSPLYLFYSRTFLMESAALAAGLWFLLGFVRCVERRSAAWWPVALVAGALACTIKITTGIVFLFAAGVWTFALWRRPSGEAGSSWKVWARAAAAAVPPLVAGLVWAKHTASVRALNIDADFLSPASLTFWTFGDLTQRFSWLFWWRTYRVWADSIVGEAGLLLLVVYFIWWRGHYWRTVAGCLVAFITGQLIFSNLYYVHDYYFYANGVFLVAAVGFCLVEMLERAPLPSWGRGLLVAAMLVFLLSAYDRRYLDAQKEETPVPEVAKLLQVVTRPDEMLVIFGRDWVGVVPYYAERKSLMILYGRERDRASMRRSIARLDPAKVGAVVMLGSHWRDASLVGETMADLKLGPRPFLFNGFDAGIWVTPEREAELRESANFGPYKDFQMSPALKPSADGVTLRGSQISHRTEFDCFTPRPIRAYARHDFSSTTVDFQKLLVAHSTTELTFALPPGASRFTATYGLADNSYTDGNSTDGIELTISHRNPGGPETKLYSRYLNPRANAADRGPQKLDYALPPGLQGELIVRILPGPNGDAGYDWSYIGQGRIE